jgi:hypothetical protein
MNECACSRHGRLVGVSVIDAFGDFVLARRARHCRTAGSRRRWPQARGPEGLFVLALLANCV